MDKSINLSLGTSLFYYSHTSANTLFSLFDLSTSDPEELIKFNSKYGISGDLSLFLSIPSNFIPNLSLQYKNIASRINRNEGLSNSATRLETSYLFDDYILIGLGKTYKTLYGRFSYNIELPTENYLSDSKAEYVNLGLNYTLKLLSVFMGLGQNYQTLGISFNSDQFNVGISYSKEKDLGDIQKKYDNSAYIGMAINL